MTFDLFSQDMIDAYRESAISSLQNVFAPLMPLFIGIIASYIIFQVIKLIVKKMTFELSVIRGYSSREAKKRAKFAGNLVELLSAFKDVFGIKK